MVNDSMLVFLLQALIAIKSVSVDNCARRHMLFYFGVQSSLETVFNDGCANFAAPFKESHDGCLVVLHAPGYAALLYAHLHIPGPAADVCFIHFDFTATTAHFLYEGSGLHRLANAVQHEPPGFLSHAKITGKLITADSVLAIHNDTDGR